MFSIKSLQTNPKQKSNSKKEPGRGQVFSRPFVSGIRGRAGIQIKSIKSVKSVEQCITSNAKKT